MLFIENVMIVNSHLMKGFILKEFPKNFSLQDIVDLLKGVF